MIAASLPPLPAGGAEMQALRLGKALTRKDVAVSYITPGRAGAEGKGELDGMPVFRLNSIFNRLFAGLSSFRKKQRPALPTRIEYDDATEQTRQIASRVGWPTIIYYHIFYYHGLFFLWRRRRSFDILHAHTMEWSAIVAVRLGRTLKKPVLIKDSTMNGLASLARFPGGSRLQQEIIAGAHFVAMTRVIEENLKGSGVPAEKISRIPNGIAISQQPARPSPAGSSTAHPSTARPPAGTLNVLFVGNLYQQPAKGIDILLKAWPSVMAAHPGATLDIVGDGDLPAYHGYAQRLGIGNTVRLRGRQTDIQAYYNNATVFVLPSRREGMSNALMEAMLSALPCVATDISGNQDLIISGSNGLLVPAADPAALSQAIVYMLGHPVEAKEMGRKARETIIRGLDIDVIAAQYFALYERLASPGKG